MLSDLAAISYEQILSYVKTEFDENINNIVAGWPAEIDNTLSLKLGFSCR